MDKTAQTDMTTPPTDRATRWMLARAVIKGVALYLIFSALYALIAPMQRGLLPTFYNGILAGRVRLAKEYEFNAYLLIDDHVISTATADTFNIVILGSSEMWGARSLADETVPAYLDAMHMVAADGRPVRVYNLAYPVPYAFKDLIILDVLLERHIPIDLVVFSVFDETFTYFNHPHYLVHGNFPLELAVIKHYGLSEAYSYVRADIGRATPFTQRLAEDATVWREWLSMQLRGIKWTLARDDFIGVPADHLQRPVTLSALVDVLPLNRTYMPLDSELMRVFQQARQESGIPILMLGAPIPYAANEFAPWLEEQTAAFGIPLLDCWDTFRDPAAFEDHYHPQAKIHPLYARILAKYLIDHALASVGHGLPLQLTGDFVPPAEFCTFFAQASAVNQ